MLKQLVADFNGMEKFLLKQHITDFISNNEAKKKTEWFILKQLVADFNSNDEAKKKKAELVFLNLGKQWLLTCQKTAKRFGDVEWLYKGFTDKNGKLKNVLYSDDKIISFSGKYKEYDYETGCYGEQCVKYINIKVECFYEDAVEKFKESCRLAAVMHLETTIRDYQKKIVYAQKQIEKIKKIK